MHDVAEHAPECVDTGIRKEYRWAGKEYKGEKQQCQPHIDLRQPLDSRLEPGIGAGSEYRCAQ